MKTPNNTPKNLRTMVQAAWGIISNSYVQGWMPGPPAIYQGKLKNFCVPGMNCYSCPGALGACPIGSMQAVFDNRRRRFAFYVVGYIATIGLLVGRFICGWLCLFGLIQELLYKIPTPKLTVPEKLDKVLRYLKYVMLVVLVFALPFFYRTELGMGKPFFCEYVCPVGTLEGGIPLVLLDETMRGALGWLFKWKFFLMALCIAILPVLSFPILKRVMGKKSNAATATVLVVLLALDGLIISAALGTSGTFCGLAVFLVAFAAAFGFDLFMLSYAQLRQPASPGA